MTKWFKRVAVVAAWLGLGTLVHAQPGVVYPVGAARMAEPLRYIPDQPPPNLSPGPVNALAAPVGPPPSLNLPSDHTSAFQFESFPPECATYAAVGGQAMLRQPLAGIPLIFQAAAGGDNGNVPPGFLTELAKLNAVDPRYVGGVRATLGFMLGSGAIELTGFYQADQEENRDFLTTGGLLVPFTGPFPIGFEGNNGIFNQADLVRLSFAYAIGSAEVNYRRWNSAILGTDLIVGLRYFYNQERVAIFADDDFFVRNQFNQSDRRRQATYTTMARTNHLGVQFGGEWSAPVPCSDKNWLWLSLMAKSSLGINFIERSYRLERGDQLVGFNIHRNTTMVGSVNEVAGFVDLHLLERLRLRAGYQYIIGLGFSTAGSQITFDFTKQGQRGADNNSIYWHGPVAELQFLF